MSNQMNLLIELERQLLIKVLSTIAQLDVHQTEFQLDRYIRGLSKSVHSQLINSLINRYMLDYCDGYSSSLFPSLFEGELADGIDLPNSIHSDSIPQLCEILHINYLNSEFYYSRGAISIKKSKNNLIEAGAVYTQDQVAYEIVQRTLSNLTVEKSESIKVLDFATGTGRFYRQIVRCLSELYRLSPNYSVINNIYAVDNDPIALNICRINALHMLDDLNYNKAQIVAKHIILKNALLKEQLFRDEMAIRHTDFDGLFYNGFDAVVSNPPYLVLKPNKNKMDSETIANINNMVKYFRNSHDYKFSIEGMLNLYQLSIEAMLGMLRVGGEMGVICPSTLFADVSASTLRKHLLSKHNVTYIKYFSEDESLFDNVTQAACIFHLTKGEECKSIDIVSGSKSYKVALEDVKHIFSSNWEIPSIEQVEWSILRKMFSISTLKELPNVRNRRGELDLTLHKEFITREPTKMRLVRGNMITRVGIADANHEYVLPEFLKKKTGDFLSCDQGHRRLICQQISNMTQRVRLRFVVCNANDILGNSCNYITIAEELMPKMKVLLNSALLNWRFKLTSTNNHINNYELGELPIIDIDSIPADIVDMDGMLREETICSLYGLDKEETTFIIKKQYDIA